MLITIQFPFADSREFISSETHKLVLPSWLAPIPDHDFVRSFGVIRRRPQGGLSGWIGESFICEASHAVSFQGLRSFEDGVGNVIKFRILFKRLYFDGLAVGKFEIGLAAWVSQEAKWKLFTGRKPLDSLTKPLLQHVLKLPVLVADPIGSPVENQLWRIGSLLAKLYAASSTKKNTLDERFDLENWWIQSCEPVILVNYNKHKYLEKNLENSPSRILNSSGTIDGLASLSHYIVVQQGQNIRTWMLGEHWASETVRQLRIFLLRLHAEKSCLKQILRNILTGKLLISRRSEKSRMLQEYLNHATKRIKRLNRYSDKNAEVAVGNLAFEAEDHITPGEFDELLKALRVIDIEKNIQKKVEDFIQQSIVVKEQIMGDQYNIGQAGAVGPNAHAHDIVFNQIGNQIEKSVDLVELARDLTVLRQAMLKEATSVEHSIAVGNVAQAEQAAKSKDTTKVAEHLQSAGKWALDIASKIGVPVAIEALKRAIGIPI